MSGEGFPQYASYLLGGQSTVLAEVNAKIGIKSIQRGEYTGGSTSGLRTEVVTISEVDVEKTTVNAWAILSAGQGETAAVVPILTNGTTLTVKTQAGAGAYPVRVGWEVVEYNG